MKGREEARVFRSLLVISTGGEASQNKEVLNVSKTRTRKYREESRCCGVCSRVEA